MDIWRPLLKKLGYPRSVCDALYHSTAARMISAGASPKAVQSIMGHRSAAFTLTVYGQLFDEDLDALAKRMDHPDPWKRSFELKERTRRYSEFQQRVRRHRPSELLPLISATTGEDH
jgi:hypothetical protein